MGGNVDKDDDRQSDIVDILMFVLVEFYYSLKFSTQLIRVLFTVINYLFVTTTPHCY